jgi:glucose dehydrogenase
MMPAYARLAALALALVSVAAAPAPGHNASSWPSWGNGLRYDRFSWADQIDTSNVGQLKPVWKYVITQKGGWEITPIVVKGTMYLQDMLGSAIALDPETGKELWRFSSGQRGKMRAVSYWPGDANHGGRIIMGVADRIYALDAATGKPSPGFGGDKGFIDIREGFASPDQQYAISSPPTVFRDLLITGPSTQEFGAKGPPGDPRAYDAITGRLVWRFHTVPHPGERNAGGWGEGWKDRAGPSAWGAMSVDEKTGLVFVPTGNPADSFIGVDRPGNNLYANSVIELDAASGKYRWHFQLVHHDLFDYDAAAAPALIDLNIKGHKVKALVEISKQGLMFILDRLTGNPVFGVDERAVPPSTIPVEKTSPTQPFPRKPAPLAKMGMTRADITTITPAANRFCTDAWNRLGMIDTAPFQPPRLDGPNLFMPANAGGLGGVWGGVSIDPRIGMIFVNTDNLPAYSYIVPADPRDTQAAGSYEVDKAYTKLQDPNGLPCVQPPWAEMIAVNANTGEIAWRRPLGSAEIYGAIDAHTGAVNLGGSLATAGGLVFIGATGLGYLGATLDQPVFRAYDARTGDELWSVRLSSPAESNPMSFVGRSGRQYVVIAASGAPREDAEVSLIAFALPRPGDPHVDLKPAPMPAQRLGGDVVVLPTMTSVTNVEDLPTGLGSANVATECTACHTIGTATTPRLVAAWAPTVEEMRDRGAKMNNDQAARIVSYLSQHFSQDVTGKPHP